MTLETLMTQLESYGLPTLYQEPSKRRWCCKLDLPRIDGLDVKLSVHATTKIAAVAECERLASEIVRDRAAEEEME